MAPQARGLILREKDEGEKAKQARSLRSIFPLEIVLKILAHLDQRTLASLCLISFSTLEEAGPFFMTNVEIISETSVYRFLVQSPISPSSRLHPSLSTSLMHTVNIRIGIFLYDHIALYQLHPHSPFPRFPNRTAVLPLRRLTISCPPPSLSHLMFFRILPMFDPIHLELLSAPNHEQSAHTPAWSTFGPDPSLICSNWTSLERVRFQGWLPIRCNDQEEEVRPFFLRYLPPPRGHSAAGSGTIRIELDVRGWWELRRWGAVLVPSALSKSGALSMGRLESLVWVVGEGEEEEAIRAGVAKLEREEREMIELTVV